MYRSADAGATWTEISRPENTTNQRITELSFLNPKQGIAGTGWNRLYLTANGGDSWKIIPTPLDQKLYTPTSKSHRPRIVGVLHTTETLLVAQNGSWFYTPTDEIAWKPVPAGTNIFGYDPTNDRLFAGRGDTIMIASRPFDGEFVSTGERIDIGRAEATVANGKLYLLGYLSSAVFDGATYRSYRNYGRNIPVTDVIYGGQKGTVKWGHRGSEIYRKTPPSGNWRRFAVLPDEIEAILPLSDESAKIRTVSGNYVFNAQDFSLTAFRLRDSLQLPPVEEIREIAIEASSHGCFHFHQDLRTFTNHRNEFRERKGRGVIPAAEVSQLLSHLLEPPLPDQLKSLPLHPAAFDLYATLAGTAIAEKESAGKHDRPRLAHLHETSGLLNYPELPDATRLVDAHQVAVAGKGGWSTTTNNIGITFSFRSGPPLKLQYQYSYSEPNYLAWRVTYGDEAFTLPSGIIREFYLNQLKSKERITADAELLLQLAVWRADQ